MINRSIQRLLVAFVLSASVIAVMVWVWNMITIQGDRLRSEQQLIVDNQTTEQQLSALEQILEESGNKRAQLTQYILTGQETISFLNQLEQYAADRALDVTIDSLTNIETEALYDQLEIAVRVSGAAQDVHSYIQILEQLPYHSDITQLNQTFTAGTENQAAAQIRLRVSITDYET